jgi:hypothetical protein
MKQVRKLIKTSMISFESHFEFEYIFQDLPAVIRKTARFLKKTLTDDGVSLLAEHLSFESMKNNPAVNKQDVVKTLQKIHGRE